MKRLSQLSILLLFFCFACATVSAQNRNGRKGTPVKAKVQNTKNSNKSKTAVKGKSVKQTSSTSSQQFEGSLLYRSYEHHNNMVRKYSNGRAYNGERTTCVLVRGHTIHSIDEGQHLHTIYDSRSNQAWLYSDLTKQGLLLDKEFVDAFLGLFSENASNPTRKINLNANSGTEIYKGDHCKIMKGQINVNETNLTDIEMWYSEKYSVDKSYSFFLQGLPLHGIVRKGIYSSTSDMGVLGKLKSTVALELVALSQYQVAKRDMNPPTDVNIVKLTDAKDLGKFYKDNEKMLSKLKLTPKIMKKKEVDYNIRDSWDFADEWIQKSYKSEEVSRQWQKIGEQLFDVLNNISELAQKDNSSNKTNVDDEGEDADYEDNNKDFDSPEQEKLYKKYVKKYKKLDSDINKLRHDYVFGRGPGSMTTAYEQGNEGVTRRKINDGIDKMQREMKKIRKECYQKTKHRIRLSTNEDFNKL